MGFSEVTQFENGNPDGRFITMSEVDKAHDFFFAVLNLNMQAMYEYAGICGGG